MELFKFENYAKLETERVKNALPKLKETSLRFAFISDLHYKFIDEMRTTVSNIVYAVNELNKTGKIDFLCLGGDNVGNYPASPEEHVEMMAELRALLENCDVPVIFVQGNHDDNSIHGRIGSSNVCRTGFEVRDEVQYDTLFSISEKLLSGRAAKISSEGAIARIRTIADSALVIAFSGRKVLSS